MRDNHRRETWVVAHRGDWRHAPENSLQAITNCIRMGVDIVEVDVRKTKDDQLVLMHDEKLDRTTTGKGNVADFTLQELKRLFLKNGAGHKTRHTIPTLEEALTLCKDKIMLNIDKGYDYLPDIKSLLMKTGMSDQVIIKSDKTYSEVSSANPDIFRNIMFMPVVNIDSPSACDIISDYLDNTDVVAFELNFSHVLPSHKILFNTIRNAGCEIFVNSLWPELCAGHDDDIAIEEDKADESWGWLIRTGASIIQTDRPASLLNYLEKNAENLIPRKIFVNPNLQTHGDGTLESPLTSLKEAVELAGHGDTICVATGIIQDKNNIGTMLDIDKCISIIGGYDESFSSISGRTTIDGAGKVKNVIKIRPLADVCLHNLIIKGGNAFGVSICGGGIFIEGNLELEKCDLIENTGTGDGGALYVDTEGYVDVRYCNFTSNISKSGSAVFIKNAAGISITGSSFADNISETYGTLTFYNKNYSGKTVVVNSTFANNCQQGHVAGKPMTGGSAIYFYGAPSSTIGIMNNTITGNRCDAKDPSGQIAPELGGAVFVRSGNLKAYNNIIAGNYSTSGYGDLYKNPGASVIEKNNIFSSRENINISSPSAKVGIDGTNNAFKTLTDHLDGSIDKDSFTANLSMGATGTYVCRIINPILPACKLNSLPDEALQEQWTGIDIDNDNNLNSTLEYDQEKNRRDQSGNACIGAVEIENPATVSTALKEIDCQITIENSNLNISSEKSSQSILYELSGNMIRKSPANVTSHTFSNLHQGIYLLSVKSSDIKRNFKIQIK